jgi:CRISPR-associated endoribonuclease Cas6
MRFSIQFTRTSGYDLLPMDYQYFISAWIYKTIKLSNDEFASFLHDRGYGSDEGKLFKLFCFSRLEFGKPLLLPAEKLFQISASTLRLLISFDIPITASHFIEGIFKDQEFYLGDKLHGLNLRVTTVELLPEPAFHETMHYRLLTPWVVSIKEEGKPQPVYLAADDERFYTMAARHLAEKHNLTHTETPTVKQEQIVIRRINGFKRSGFVISPGTPRETRVVGNLFEFTLTAPISIHQMAWNAGISEKSSMGFGMVEVKKENNKQ